MTEKTFASLAGAIFALVALFHLVRIMMGWSVVIGGCSIPMWASWIGFAVSAGLAYFGLMRVARG